jgi:hypothetical protein
MINARPSDVSNQAHAFVRIGEWRVYLVTSTVQFVRARRAASACGSLEDIRWIASVLAHEEWHLTHHVDERGAYEAQLTALAYMGAGPGNPLYSQVWRSMGAVRTRLTPGRRGTQLSHVPLNDDGEFHELSPPNKAK